MVDGRKDLRGPHQQATEGDDAHPGNTPDHLEDARHRIPAAVKGIEAEEKTGLNDRSRLSNQKLHAQKEGASGEVAPIRAEQKAANEQAGRREPCRAEENGKEIDVGEIEPAH